MSGRLVIYQAACPAHPRAPASEASGPPLFRGTWGPDNWKGPNPPRGSWDPDGHWDVDKGDKSPRDHYDPKGNPITPGTAHPGNAPTTMMDRMKSITPGPIIKMGAWGIVGYIIIDEGSRFVFPARNLVPVP